MTQQLQALEDTNTSSTASQDGNNHNKRKPDTQNPIENTPKKAHQTPTQQATVSPQHSQETLTNTDNTSSQSCKPGSQPKNATKPSSYIRVGPHIPKHDIQQLDPDNKAKHLWNYRKQMLTARHLKEADAFYQLYQHHLQAKKVIEYRMYTTNKRKAEEHDTHDQEQYLTEYEPLIMEEWALHLLQ